MPESQRENLLNYSDSVLCEFLIERSDPALVLVVKELGVLANGIFAQLKVVEIPDDVDYQIEDDDGFEHIAEVHRTWC